MKKPKSGGGYKGKGFNGLSKPTGDGPKAARTAKPAEKPVNPFERKPSSKKHDVLGRVRGSKQAAKSVTKARSEAWEGRKKTLGIEARQEGRSNSFVDRRFGEQVCKCCDQAKLLCHVCPCVCSCAYVAQRCVCACMV